MNTKNATNRITKTDPDDVPLSYCRRVQMMEYVPDYGVTVVYLEGREVLQVQGKPEVLINRWCLANASSMAGRIEAVKALTSIKSKHPVLLNEGSLRMIFPMRSTQRRGANTWICDNALMRVERNKRESTVLIFNDGFRLEIPYDIRMVRRQLNNCQLIRQALLEQHMKMELFADETGKEPN